MRKNNEMPLEALLEDPLVQAVMKSHGTNRERVRQICLEAQLGIRQRKTS